MILHTYYARRFLSSFAVVFGAFAAIAFLTGLIEQIGELSGRADGIWPLIWLALLKMPQTLYQILPLIVVLGSVTLFLSLARASELVVSRAAGQSASRALIGPSVVVLLIGMLAVAAGNPIVAATAKAYEARRAEISGEIGQVAAVGPGGLWLREGSPEGHRVIRAAHASQDGTLLSGVSLHLFDKSGQPQSRIEAATARLGDSQWILTGTKSWPLTAPAPERAAVTQQVLTLPSRLTAEGIREGFGAPSSMPIWELPGFIRELSEAGFSARRHLLWLHSELAQPVFMLAMLTMAAGLTMGHQRGARTGLRVLTAVMLGFGLYFVRNFAMVLGENGQLPPVMAAWAPPVAAWMLAYGMLLQREDG